MLTSLGTAALSTGMAILLYGPAQSALRSATGGPQGAALGAAVAMGAVGYAVASTAARLRSRIAELSHRMLAVAAVGMAATVVLLGVYYMQLGHRLAGSGEPEPVEFLVTYGSPPRPGLYGMVGRGGYFVASVKMAPRYEIPGDGTVHLILGPERVSSQQLVKCCASGLAVLGFEFALMDFNPPGAVRSVRALFDRGETVSNDAGLGTYTLAIPAGATRLRGFEVEWQWEDYHKFFPFGATSKTLPLGVCGAILGLALKRKRARPFYAECAEDSEKP
jgi:F0F1-type ATP synthase membrane subunit c/vacuolar-type H+-ATPase subunit K